MTLTGISVQIFKLWPWLLAFSLAILNFAASCAYGIPEQELNIMYASTGWSEMKLSKGNTISSESSAFAYLAEKFPSLSQAKIKEGIFIDPQIRKLVLDEIFITF